MAQQANTAPDEQTIESLLNNISDSRRRLDSSYAKFYDQFVNMGFATRPPAEPSATIGAATGNPIPREKTMLEKLASEAYDLNTLANSFDWAASTLNNQYKG